MDLNRRGLNLPFAGDSIKTLFARAKILAKLDERIADKTTCHVQIFQAVMN